MHNINAQNNVKFQNLNQLHHRNQRNKLNDRFENVFYSLKLFDN